MISYLYLLKFRCQSCRLYSDLMLVAMISQANAARYYRDKAIYWLHQASTKGYPPAIAVLHAQSWGIPHE